LTGGEVEGGEAEKEDATFEAHGHLVEAVELGTEGIFERRCIH
jgi:hypothetical protein